MWLFSSVSPVFISCEDGLLNYLLSLDREGDKKSQKIINEIENIDDECEEKSIDFVKTSDEGIEEEYDLPGLPALAFYRHQFRTIYTGDLMKEDDILEWVLQLHESRHDEIESVDRKTLQVLINEKEHLAVFFCKWMFVQGGIEFTVSLLYFPQMTTTASPALAFWRNWRPSTMTLTSMASSLSSRTTSSWPMRSASSPSLPWSTTRREFQLCLTVSLSSSCNYDQLVMKALSPLQVI